MNTTQLIRKVQNQTPLSKEEISYVVDSFHKDELPTYQMSALLMAIYFNGLSSEEKMHLTQAMLNSGVQMKWPDAELMLDKHSTGGVGDKTSLILAPLLASLGYKVPMMAGRGLGHTGGTLDKLESLKGFNVDLDMESFKNCVEDHGGCIIGQTKDLCPADKKIYALRDVTATVSSLPLITASIVSKKVAEGVSSIVYDVKTGTGAFVKDFEDSLKLAESLVETSQNLGLKASALITDMSQPLGRYVGNVLEVLECFEIMSFNEEAQEKYKDTIEVTAHLCAQLVSQKESIDLKTAKDKVHQALASGKAYEKALEIYKAQGWSGELPKLPETKVYEYHLKESDGYLSQMDNENIGWACVELGGGRKRLEDKIDPEVGFYFYKKLGDAVTTEEPLLKIYYNDEKKLESALELLDPSFKTSKTQPETPQLIQRTVTYDS